MSHKARFVFSQRNELFLSGSKRFLFFLNSWECWGIPWRLKEYLIDYMNDNSFAVNSLGYRGDVSFHCPFLEWIRLKGYIVCAKYFMEVERHRNWLLAVSGHNSGSNPGQVMWESCQWLDGCIIVEKSDDTQNIEILKELNHKYIELENYSVMKGIFNLHVYFWPNYRGPPVTWQSYFLGMLQDEVIYIFK